ncbi:MAG: glycosyltransferase family 4 protein [Chitinophagales bacterium]
MFDQLDVVLFIVFFVISTFVSFLINWLFLRFTRNLSQKNNEDLNQERWSAEVKPSLGGFSFFIVFLISISIASIFAQEMGGVINKQVIGILAASTLGFIIGLADDTYNTNPLVKFMGQLTCAFILILMDVYIPVTGNLAIDYGITTLWVIGLMNSINMLDNMDGITSTASMTILLTAIIFAFTGEAVNTNYIMLLLGVFGSLLGFLYFNWNPAKMYMGDTGSQFLGVFLAAISIIFFWQEKDLYGGVFQIKQFVIPMLVFIVPLMDTLTVSVRRLMRKQSPFVGGRDHTTHHLVFFGFTEKQTAWILILIASVSIPFVTLLHIGFIEWTWHISLGSFIYFALVFGVMQKVYNIGKQKLEAKT